MKAVQYQQLAQADHGGGGPKNRKADDPRRLLNAAGDLRMLIVDCSGLTGPQPGTEPAARRINRADTVR